MLMNWGIEYPSSKPPKYSKVFEALIVIKALPFPLNQVYEIASYGDSTQFYGKPWDRLSWEQPNLNTK
jgi:hypothetical protein